MRHQISNAQTCFVIIFLKPGGNAFNSFLRCTPTTIVVPACKWNHAAPQVAPLSLMQSHDKITYCRDHFFFHARKTLVG